MVDILNREAEPFRITRQGAIGIEAREFCLKQALPYPRCFLHASHGLMAHGGGHLPIAHQRDDPANHPG